MDRWFNRKTKPPFGSVEIDWGHPLAPNFDCLLFNEGVGAPINLASPGVKTDIISHPPAWTATSEGLAGYTTGGVDFEIPWHGNIVAADFTCHVRFIADSWAGTYTILFDGGQSGGVAVFVNTSGQVRYVTVGGANQDAINLGSMPVGSVHSLTITRLAGAAPSIYIDGIFVVQVTPNGTTDWGSANNFSYGRNPSGGGTVFDGKYLLAHNSLRGITAGQAFALHVEPYAFLRPIIRRNYFIKAAAAATFQASWARGSNAMIGAGKVG